MLNPLKYAPWDAFYMDAQVINTAHNGYLDQLLQTGVVGFSLGVLAIVRCVAALWSAAVRTRDEEERLALLGLTCLAICLILNNFLESYLFRSGDGMGYLFFLIMLQAEQARLGEAGCRRLPSSLSAMDGGCGGVPGARQSRDDRIVAPYILHLIRAGFTASIASAAPARPATNSGGLTMGRWLGAVLLLLGFPLFVNFPAGAAPVRWTKASGGNGHTYEAVYVPAGLNWVQAQLAVAGRGCGWYLATITSAAENRFAFGLIAKRPELFVEDLNGPWLGGFQVSSRSEPKGDWRRVTGEAFRYTSWAPGQPNDYVAGDSTLKPGIPTGQQEGFLQFIGHAGQWNDLNVNSQPRGYASSSTPAATRRAGPKAEAAQGAAGILSHAPETLSLRARTSRAVSALRIGPEGMAAPA